MTFTPPDPPFVLTRFDPRTFVDASNRHSYLLLTNPSEVHSGANRYLPNLLESMRGSEEWFGFIGYEFGEITEDIVPRPACEWSLPDYWLGRFRSSEFIQLKPSKSEHAGGAKVEASLTTKEYLGCLGRIREYLRAGDIYQTNLSVRFETTTDEDPLNLFLSIAERSRSGYACYLDTGEFQVLSVSPELFLHVDQGAIVTCPIKGTMGKTGKPEIDREIYQQLLESEKNLAELLMIVDLERNDLGKICEFGSVSVDQFPEILELPHLFHLLATVRGRLRGGVSLSDILSATFPGGSISGAPKRRALEIIRELEPHRRGPYCGAMGFLSGDSAHLNLAIRTAVMKERQLRFWGGGGIVIDHDPHSEREEVIDKLTPFLDTLGVARGDFWG